MSKNNLKYMQRAGQNWESVVHSYYCYTVQGHCEGIVERFFLQQVEREIQILSGAL